MAEDPEDFSPDRLIDDLDSEGGVQRLQMLHPVDLADLLEDLDPEERARILERLDPPYASTVVEAIQPSLRVTLAENLTDDALAAIAEHMPNDTLTDLVQHLPEHRRSALTAKMNPEDRRELETLRRYRPHTAGGLMSTNFVKVPDTFTTNQTWKAIQGAIDAETIAYIYVVSDDGVLVGVTSIRSILQQTAEAPLRTFMVKEVVSVPVGMDQEEVARVVRDYDIAAVPVVDPQKRLLGVITVDNVIDVIQHEASEDMYKMAGTGVDDPVYDPVLRRLRVRAAWLAMTIVLGLTSAFLISRFEETLAEVVMLSFFIPIIMALGGGVGMQSSTIVIRGLATGQVTLQRGLRVVFAESRTGMLAGLVCGAVTGAVGMLFAPDRAARFGLAIFLAMSASVLIAATWGAIVPLMFQRLKIDPAVASGPLITSTNDLISVLLYLGIATLLVL